MRSQFFPKCYLQLVEFTDAETAGTGSQQLLSSSVTGLSGIVKTKGSTTIKETGKEFFKTYKREAIKGASPMHV